jgi:hypothetical protein
VERVVLGVRPGQLTWSIGVDRTEYMVVGEQVIKAQFLDRSPDLPNSGRISSKLNLGVNNADLHRIQPSSRWDQRAVALDICHTLDRRCQDAIATAQTTITVAVLALTPPGSPTSVVGEFRNAEVALKKAASAGA